MVFFCTGIGVLAGVYNGPINSVKMLAFYLQSSVIKLRLQVTVLPAGGGFGKQLPQVQARLLKGKQLYGHWLNGKAPKACRFGYWFVLVLRQGLVKLLFKRSRAGQGLALLANEANHLCSHFTLCKVARGRLLTYRGGIALYAHLALGVVKPEGKGRLRVLL